MSPERSYDALVLAGRRGPDDALAAATGAPHRALLDVQGVPMLERVVRTLHASPIVGRISVSIDAPELLANTAGLRELMDDDAFAVLPSADSPSRSVLAALEASDAGKPLLVTTADHALLDAEMVHHFLEAADESAADVSVGLVTATLLTERFPESKRTYLHFRGESYSGANLFAFRTANARLAVSFWQRAEQFRKQPWRLVSAFGPVSLVLFALRRLDLDDAFLRASRVIGAEIRPVLMPFAEAAVDVDRVSDLELVNRILADRPQAP